MISFHLLLYCHRSSVGHRATYRSVSIPWPKIERKNLFDFLFKKCFDDEKICFFFSALFPFSMLRRLRKNHLWYAHSLRLNATTEWSRIKRLFICFFTAYCCCCSCAYAKPKQRYPSDGRTGCGDERSIAEKFLYNLVEYAKEANGDKNKKSNIIRYYVFLFIRCCCCRCRPSVTSLVPSHSGSVGDVLGFSFPTSMPLLLTYLLTCTALVWKYDSDYYTYAFLIFRLFYLCDWLIVSEMLRHSCRCGTEAGASKKISALVFPFNFLRRKLALDGYNNAPHTHTIYNINEILLILFIHSIFTPA